MKTAALALFVLAANHVVAANLVLALAAAPRGSGYEDGPRQLARFRNPDGVATDALGNVYVADTGNHTIRKITPTGVTTLAGVAGMSGSADGKGASARFYYPHGLALDQRGNIYVADSWNHTIRKITPDGVVTTFAGGPGLSGSTDGWRHEARFFMPFAVATDPAGNVYVADEQNSTIRRITPAGAVTTLAGRARNPGSRDGPGSAAQFHEPRAVAVDRHGNVFVADTNNHTIRKISSNGHVTTVAGSAGKPGRDDGIGTAATFHFPLGVAVDAEGNIVVGDSYNHAIRRITAKGVVTTLAGTIGRRGASDGSAKSARFQNPIGVATDRDGNIYVADYHNHAIRKISPRGMVTTYAGRRKTSDARDGSGSNSRPPTIGIETVRNRVSFRSIRRSAPDCHQAR